MPGRVFAPFSLLSFCFPLLSLFSTVACFGKSFLRVLTKDGTFVRFFGGAVWAGYGTGPSGHILYEYLESTIYRFIPLIPLIGFFTLTDEVDACLFCDLLPFRVSLLRPPKAIKEKNLPV